MIGRTAVVLVLLAGCDQAFGLERDEVALVCPTSFREIDGGYYQRIDDVVTWYQAETACEAQRDPALSGQVHLAVISSDAELAAITANLTITSYWLGHSDLEAEGTYVPVTPEVIDWPPAPGTAPWDGNQPNNLAPGQHCLHVDGQGLLDDKKCITEPQRFVCECDLFPAAAPLPP